MIGSKLHSIKMPVQPLSQETQNRYRKLYDQLREFGVQRGFCGREEEKLHGPVVDAFFEARKNWTPREERLINKAVLFVLESAVEVGDSSADFAKRRFDVMRDADHARRIVGAMPKSAGDKKASTHSTHDKAEAAHARVHRRRSQRPQQLTKKSPRARAASIRATLLAITAANSKWKNEAADWYRAALLTGVSPQEWRAATIVDCGRGRHALCIDVAGKSGRIARILPLDRLTREQLELVCKHLSRAAAYAQAGTFGEWFDSCRKLLRTEVSKFWPAQEPLPTLQAKRYLLASTDSERLNSMEVAAVDEL